MIRRLVVGLIVIGLAVGIWALWPRESPDPTPTTPPIAIATTTTTVPSATTVAPTTVTTGETHIVTTVEEAEEILRGLWFGWFEGIYNQDEARIRQVVGNQNQVEAAVAQFGQLEISRSPNPQDFEFAGTEILESSDDCTAVLTEMSGAGFSDPVSVDGVHVFRWIEENWLFVSLWQHREDLWEADCAALL